MPGPFPFETLGSVWPAMGVGLGPKVPTSFNLITLLFFFFFCEMDNIIVVTSYLLILYLSFYFCLILNILLFQY